MKLIECAAGMGQWGILRGHCALVCRVGFFVACVVLLREYHVTPAIFSRLPFVQAAMDNACDRVLLIKLAGWGTRASPQHQLNNMQRLGDDRYSSELLEPIGKALH